MFSSKSSNSSTRTSLRSSSSMDTLKKITSRSCPHFRRFRQSKHPQTQPVRYPPPNLVRKIGPEDGVFKGLGAYSKQVNERKKTFNHRDTTVVRNFDKKLTCKVMYVTGPKPKGQLKGIGDHSFEMKEREPFDHSNLKPEVCRKFGKKKLESLWEPQKYTKRKMKSCERLYQRHARELRSIEGKGNKMLQLNRRSGLYGRTYVEKQLFPGTKSKKPNPRRQTDLHKLFGEVQSPRKIHDKFKKFRRKKNTLSKKLRGPSSQRKRNFSRGGNRVVRLDSATQVENLEKKKEYGELLKYQIGRKKVRDVEEKIFRLAPHKDDSLITWCF